MKRCATCGKQFRPTNRRVAPQQLYCSGKCKIKAYWTRRVRKGEG